MIGRVVFSYPYIDKKSRSGNHGAERVVRGGSWGYVPRNVRCANRYRDVPGGFDVNFGFRLASPMLGPGEGGGGPNGGVGGGRREGRGGGGFRGGRDKDEV
ncbi:MAG: SUMF1/EgtB/PvdO family nonheme iron enzyme [Anaerolineales bacterium]|nr:SUMF1/EgtB/PvdO family nonheme iron enzyme [Anaerolineales bacterium]